mmetsp:Transcript_473/g.930  ORF Transcript_473/g.930 Transcript_473/m.930 type:complete len:336 (+) Transcript_473:387-1394(+)
MPKPEELLKERGWEKLVQDKVKTLIDEKIVVLKQDYAEGKSKASTLGGDQGAGGGMSQGDGTQILTYINNVVIKVPLKDVTSIQADQKSSEVKDLSKQEFLEQKFKVTKETTFIQMKNEACNFWELDKNLYTLTLPNMHDLMTLNKEPTHIAHTLAKYFEIHRAKTAVLHLVKPEKTRRELYPEEKSFIQIKGVAKTSRFEGGDKRSFEEIKKDVDSKNLNMFFDKYPDLREVQIFNMKQFDSKAKGKMNIRNPDMSFCAFILSFSMLCLSIFIFYSHRDFNNEYFNRQLIYQKMVNNPLGLQQYSDIKSVEDLKFFLNETIAYQVFEPKGNLSG